MHFEGIFLDEIVYSEYLQYESIDYIRKNPKINTYIFGFIGNENKLHLSDSCKHLASEAAHKFEKWKFSE